jgi:hypothetical protein
MFFSAYKKKYSTKIPPYYNRLCKLPPKAKSGFAFPGETHREGTLTPQEKGPDESAFPLRKDTLGTKLWSKGL